MPTDEQRQALRALPQVEELLRYQEVTALLDALPRDMVVRMVREAIDGRRAAILDGASEAPAADDIAADVLKAARMLDKPSLRRTVNASGIIVHTNLGRSALADAAVQAVTEVARGYSTLEYDCSKLARGSRHDHYERLMCALTGAEAAIAVNNNAAAVMMVLAEFAGDREAVISRGELVEIGGSFRMPDIMALSGARMVEVGTTNKTHLFDYERAITEDTALLLKVHPSNYHMTGFTQSISARELRGLADRANAKRRTNAAADGTNPGKDEAAAADVLVYEDLGSGALVDIACGGVHERTVREALSEGSDLVSFSCDKLLGGPQAGIVVGRRDLVGRLKSSPLARVLRLDKMGIAALEATLRLYVDERQARTLIPTVRMLDEDAEDVLERTRAIERAIAGGLSAGDAELTIEPDISRVGGGALPMCDIPTYVVRVAFKQGCAQDCERHLVAGRDIPIVARINSECIVLDGRTVLDGDEIAEIGRAFKEYFDSLH